MKRLWGLRAVQALLAILLALAPSPGLAGNPPPKARPPAIAEIQILDVSPSTARAGQVGTIRFTLTTNVPVSDDAAFKSLVDRDFSLSVDSIPANLMLQSLTSEGINLIVWNAKAAAVSVDEPLIQHNVATTRIGLATFTYPQFEDEVEPARVALSASSASAELKVDKALSLGAFDQKYAVLVLAAVAAMAGYLVWRKRRPSLTDKVDLSNSEEGSAAPAKGAHPPIPWAAKPGAVPKADVGQPPPDVPEDLVSALAAGNAVLVLGSGASAQAGIPSGSDFVLALMDRLGEAVPDSFRQVLKNPDPKAEIEALMLRLGGFAKLLDALSGGVAREKLVPALEQVVTNAQTTGTSELHMRLAQMPWRAAVNLTWDSLANRYFVGNTNAGAAMRSMTVFDSEDLAAAGRSGDRILFEPLGDFSRPTTIALTFEEMRRLMLRAPAFQRTLAGLLQTSTFLFLGVGVDSIESFLQTMAGEYEDQPSRHFALVPEDPANDVRATGFARLGLSLVSYRADAGHTAVGVFVNSLRAAFRTDAVAAASPSGSAYLLSTDRISRLRLQNIGPFTDLDLPLAAGETDDGSAWTVIFGGNGVGKSTILKSIAAVMAGDHRPALDAAGRLLRSGSQEGLIELQMGGQTLRTRLVRDRSGVVVSSLQQTPLALGNALVLGFPALRGARSAEPTGPSSRIEPRDPDPQDLVHLIAGEVDGRLADFKQWLVNTLVNANDGQVRAIKMRDLLDSLIKELVPGEIQGLAPLDSSFVVRVTTPDGPIPFDEISQGMSSIFNWVGLLVQRLFSICEHEPANEPAVVLIDEIDAHLHPDWQRNLVELTKRHFPNLQLIATSHSPLLAGALHGYETRVLHRDASARTVAPLPYQIDLYGRRAQDILTSPMFGLESDRNPEIERKVREYFAIFEKPENTPGEQASLITMADELRQFGYFLDPRNDQTTATELPPIASEADAALVADHLAELEEVANPVARATEGGAL